MARVTFTALLLFSIHAGAAPFTITHKVDSPGIINDSSLPDRNVDAPSPLYIIVKGDTESPALQTGKYNVEVFLSQADLGYSNLKVQNWNVITFTENRYQLSGTGAFNLRLTPNDAVRVFDMTDLASMVNSVDDAVYYLGVFRLLQIEPDWVINVGRFVLNNPWQVSTTVSMVPEPSLPLLLALGLTVLLISRKLKNY